MQVFSSERETLGNFPRKLEECSIKTVLRGNSLAVQWLRCYTFTAEDLGLSPG